MRRYFNHIIFIFLIAFGFAGCKQDMPVVMPQFEVTVPQNTYKIGDTVRFKFTSNNADFVVYYSGEIGRRYSNANRLSQAGINKLVFQTSMQQGIVPPAASLDSLKLLISTNLTGYDSVSIAKATWTDITSRNTKWPTSLSASYTASDSINISDFNTASQVNIAFRYLGNSYAVAQRKYEIQNLTLSNNLFDGTNTPLFATSFLGNTTISVSTIAPASTFAYTGWVECSFKNVVNAWNVGTWNVSGATSLTNTSGISIRTSYPITFDPGSAAGLPPNDDWLITTAVDLKTVKPDAGTVLQDKLTVNALTGYNYVFKAAGTYTITFIASNQNTGNSMRVVKQLTLTVQ